MTRLGRVAVQFQHTAARRRLNLIGDGRQMVQRFNTQPPEGGWSELEVEMQKRLFQHTAARRRLLIRLIPVFCSNGFNTQPPEGGWSVIAYD